MPSVLIYPVGTTPACRCAVKHLQSRGIALTDHPTPEITHLMLDVPSFSPDGALRGGGSPEDLLRMLPGDITVIGGNLTLPCLRPYQKLDLLQMESYLAQNATITAHCALTIAASRLQTCLYDTPTLIIGWGRIGKCLARMLRSLDTPVTVAARREESRAALHSLGYRAISLEELEKYLPSQRLLINTAPEPILGPQALDACPDCLALDLASKKGLDAANVLWARGLPGIHAPESSGRLIAETILREVKL